MLAHLIRKEILDQLLSLRFVILAALAWLIVAIGFYDGIAYYRSSVKTYREAQTATEERIQQLRDADGRISPTRWYYSEIFGQGYLAHKPPTAMSVFVRGLEPALGRTITVKGGFAERRLTRSPVAEEPILEIFPSMDLGLIVQVVLSLFVVLLTYDAICGEKEMGTLRLIASFPLPRYQILVAKFVGSLVAVLIAFGLPLLLGIATVLALPDIHLQRAELIRLGIIVAVTGVYLATLICAGLLASALTHRTATSFVLLLTFWVATVVVLPRLSLIVADAARSAPSVAEFEGRKRSAYWEEDRARSARCREWARDYEESTGQPYWASPEGWEAWYSELQETKRHQWKTMVTQRSRLQEAFRNRYDAWLGLAITMARFSPTFSLSNASIRLAGTGMDRHKRFLRFCEEFLDRQHMWTHETFLRGGRQRDHPGKYGSYRWDISDMPRLDYRDTWPREDIKAAAVDIAILVLWGIALLVGGFASMLRFDVR
jgi:ABC-type transport system involved in multi-copper enzyme maturation permease subunit